MVRNNVYRLVNCGTLWQHYENRAYSPTSFYAATKQAFLCLLQFYTETTPLRVVDLALSDTYGPHDRRVRVFSLLFRAAAGGEPIPFSAGRQLVDPVYIDDVVAAFLEAGDRLREMPEGTCERYAVRSRHPLELRDLVATFAEVTGLAPNIAWGARPYRRREMMAAWTCGTDLPGWRPQIDIREGIRRLHDEWKREAAKG
jgi:nucleoside-diphosphate-sugar epimerase